ncbi:MAG: TIR domain-containing protein, partial [Aurantimonas endophytica]|uniref:TIR domain-containing protein n=1 Tax=Aurantimonas endophytica TaxID=1522175 RepID=UPI003001092D
MASVFFSYSHADETLRDRLEVGLAMLKRQGVIDTWHDRRIPVGDRIDSSISEAMEAADVVLLLVSPDFLASNYCYDVEMKRALERNERDEARLIPIILRPCDWHQSPLSSLLAAPKDGKPITKWADVDEAFQDVVARIRAALPKQHMQAAARPATIATVTEDLPRSSNLRLSKSFTQADQDRFLDEAFEFMARFFESSLDELQARNPGIETRYKRVDGNRFTAVVYRDGDAKARCKIMLGGMMGNG